MQQRFRLRRRVDFARLRQEGRAYQDRLMVFSVVPNSLTHNRYGFITSKSIGNAVTRNRVRRLLREAVRYLHPHLKPGYDVVIIARRGLVGKPFAVMLRIVEQLAHQANLIMEGQEE